MIDNADDEKVNKIIRDLLRKKMQPNQVPKQLMTKVNTALDAEKTIAINKGSIAKVKQIHKIKSDLIRAEQIRSVVSCHSSLPLLHRRSSLLPQYSNEELEETLQDMVDGQPLDHSKTDMVQDLIALTKEKINFLIEEQEYTVAQTYEDVLRKLFVISNEAAIEKKHTNKKDNYEKMLQEAKESLEMAKIDFEQALNDFTESAEETIQDAKEKHQQELNDFDEETLKGPPSQYFKMSKQYLTLREQQKALVKSKKYEEAASLKEEADRLEKQEKQELTEKYYTERLITRNNLYNVYLSNLECLDEQLSRKKNKIMVEGKADIQSRQRNVDNLQKQFSYTKRLLKNDKLNSIRSSLKTRKSCAKASQRSRTNSSMASTMPSQRSDQPLYVSTQTQTNKRFNFATLKPLDPMET